MRVFRKGPRSEQTNTALQTSSNSQLLRLPWMLLGVPGVCFTSDALELPKKPGENLNK